MEPKELHLIYKQFCDLAYYYSRDLALSMADNELYRRYRSSLSVFLRYLVQTFAKYGITDVLAYKSVDDYEGRFVGIPDPEYWWINRDRYPELGRLEDEMFKLCNASKRCNADVLKSMIPMTSFVEKTILELKKYNYTLSFDIKTKVDTILSIRELLEKRPKGFQLELRDRRRYLWDFVSDVYNFWYRYFKNIGEELLFFRMFETANIEVRYRGENSIEESLNQTYKLFKIPRNPLPYIEFEYKTEESIKPKKIVVEKPKTIVPKPKKEAIKPTPKVNEITPKKEIANKPSVTIETKVQKTNENVETANILTISKYTRLADGYRIDKVDNVAKKIIISDNVCEISSMAFRECHKLEEVTLSKNLKVLKFGLFSNLPNLTKINFVEGLEKIENNVFEQTPLKGEISLPNSLKVIGNRAFYTKVPELVRISLSKNSIEEENISKSFHPLIKLDIRGMIKQETVVKKEYSDICNSPFAFETEMSFYVSTAVDLYRVHEVLVIPNAIKKVGFRKESKNGVDTNKVKKFVIPSHVTTLFENTFVMFKELEELEFDEDSLIYELPNYMIGDCNIKHIIVPDSVGEIRRSCFTLCKSLESISVSKHVRTTFLDLPEGCKIIVRD